MLCAVTLSALLLSFLNWGVFVFVVFLTREPPAVAAPRLDQVEKQGLDPTKVMAATGSLAGAFKRAGAAPTAAAMCLVCLLIAAIAAGINQIA
ncbi:hypothetical protein [Phenylobacterium sp.]|uniref:hypothetical protein n=1 Tax=Phenylobacterium sp. TaxID=1871053 RepID=UPI002FCC5A91